MSFQAVTHSESDGRLDEQQNSRVGTKRYMSPEVLDFSIERFGFNSNLGHCGLQNKDKRVECHQVLSCVRSKFQSIESVLPLVAQLYIFLCPALIQKFRLGSKNFDMRVGKRNMEKFLL